MKIKEAENLHKMLIQKWINEGNPTLYQLPHSTSYNFSEYLRFAKTIRPDCLDFRSVGGAAYRAEIWFDQQTGQLWTR